MKLLHTSDWHLGKILYGKSMLEDQAYFIEHTFFPALKEEKPDAVLIAGDVFDRQVAPADAIRLFDGVIARVYKDFKLPLIVATGNHDGADRFSLGAGLLRLGGFYLTARPDLTAAPIILRDEFGEAHIYSLPWLEPVVMRDMLERPELKGYHEAYAAATGTLRERFVPGVRRVLLAHCFVAGSKKSESESPLFVGGGGEVGNNVFEGFDYVALGHLHAPQRAGKNARYSGSPLKYSFDEQNQRKSMTIVTLMQSETSITEIPVTPLRDMRTLTGSITEIESMAEKYGGDYICANILGDPVFEPMARLKTRFPNILEMRNGVNPEAGDTVRGEMRAQLRKRDDVYIYEQFLRQIYGQEASGGDIDIFREISAQREEGESA